MFGRDREPKPTKPGESASDTSRESAPGSAKISQSNVVFLTPRLRQNADDAGEDDHGQDSSRHEHSHTRPSPFESAVKKSRATFIMKLGEYHAALCRAANCNADELGAALDQAMLAANRIGGVGHTLGFGDLGDAAHRAETAILAYKKQTGSAERRRVFRSRIRRLARMIEAICADYDVGR